MIQGSIPAMGGQLVHTAIGGTGFVQGEGRFSGTVFGDSRFGCKCTVVNPL